MLRWGEFPGDPVIRTHAFTTKDTGLSLVSEGRHHQLCHTAKKKKYLKKLRLEQKGRLLWEAGKLISIDLDNIMAVLESIKYIKKANGLFFLKPISSCKKHKISNN